MIVTGDPSQTDLTKEGDSVCLDQSKFCQILRGFVINFGQKGIVRDKMVTKIINAYDSYDDQIKDLFDQKN